MPKLRHSRSIFVGLTIIILLTSFFIVGCTSTTKPKTGSLTGSVSLVNDTGDTSLDPQDNSGVSVALYSSVTIDTTLARINQEHPGIGIIMGQNWVFDHREHTPVKTATSDVNGSFRVEQIAPGRYNLVAFKEGWGVKYIYGIDINEGENNLSESFATRLTSISLSNKYPSKVSIILYPQTVVTSVVQSPITFRSDHVYLIQGDISVLSPAVIESGAIILVEPGHKLDFYNSLTSQNAPSKWWITSSYGFFGVIPVSLSPSERFLRISHNGGTQVSLTSGKISFIQDGFAINSNGAQLDDIFMIDGGLGLLGNGQNLVISNSVFNRFADRSLYLTGNSTINGNIFAQNHDNLVILDVQCEVGHNYFAHNWLGIRPIYGDIWIHHNAFMNNRWAISTVASDPLIEFNNFFGSIRYCIQTQVNYVQVYQDYSNPIVKNNNFFTSLGTAVSIKPDEHEGYYHSYWVGVANDVEAKQNYWKASDPSSVIIDADDNSTYQFRVLYLPKTASRIISAGV